jgi:hypothetical protein
MFAKEQMRQIFHFHVRKRTDRPTGEADDASVRTYLIRMLEMAGLDSSLMFLLVKLCSAYRYEPRRLTCALVQEQLNCDVLFWE